MREQMMLYGFEPQQAEAYRMRLLMAEVAMARNRLEMAQKKLDRATAHRDQVTLSEWLRTRDELASRVAAVKFG